jgi:hypothetical protein
LIAENKLVGKVTGSLRGKSRPPINQNQIQQQSQMHSESNNMSGMCLKSQLYILPDHWGQGEGRMGENHGQAT